MKRMLIRIAIASLLMASPAVAAEAPAFNWSGFYAGLDGGAAWARQSVSNFACNTCATVPQNATIGGSSLTGGAYAGYNVMVAPTWLAGIEADWSWVGLNDTTAAPQVSVLGGPPLPSQGNTWSRNVDWLASARGRLGFTGIGATLFYVTGGAAWGGTSYAGQDIFVGGCPNCALTSFAQTKAGYVVGGGAEWSPWANNWLFRAEYLYYRLAGATSTVSLVGFPTLPVTFSWSGLSISEARVGVAYKF